MENKIQVAADNLLTRGDITETEHNELCKVAFDIKGVAQGLQDLGGKRKQIMNILSGIAMIGGGLYAGKELIVDPLVESNKINKSFAAMAEKVPQLADQDQDQVRDYFGVVKTFSPKAASNPLVAGALVNKMIQFGGVDHKLVQDLAAIQAGIPQPKVAPTIIESLAKVVATPTTQPTEKTKFKFDDTTGKYEPFEKTTETEV